MKKLLISILLLSVLLSRCSNNISRNDILLTVNGEAIYERELEQISSEYIENDFM